MTPQPVTPQQFKTMFAGDDLRTVAEARRWARNVLTSAGLPDGLVCDALTCVSELSGNAARHTRSGAPGGSYGVVLEVGDRAAHVEVVDQGGTHVPTVQLGGDESGRGLWICARLGVLQHTTTRGGWRRVWVDLPHPGGLADDAHPGDGGGR